MKKYELIKESKTDTGICEIFRIRALRGFGDIKAGDVGGYVAGEHNLSHDGAAWIADDAQVTGNARVSENALVCDFAWVSGDSRISGDAIVGGWAEVKSGSLISGNAFIWAPKPDKGPRATRESTPAPQP